MKRNTLVGLALVTLAILTSGCSSCAGDDRPQQEQQQPTPNTQLPKTSSPRRIHSPLTGLTQVDGAVPPPPGASAAPDDAGH